MSEAFDLRKALDAAVLGTFRRHVAEPAQGADSSDTAIADALDELRDRFLAAIEAEARQGYVPASLSPEPPDMMLGPAMRSNGWRVELFWNGAGRWFTARLVSLYGDLVPDGNPIGASGATPDEAFANLQGKVLEWGGRPFRPSGDGRS